MQGDLYKAPGPGTGRPRDDGRRGAHGRDCTREELRDLYKKVQRSQWLPDEVLPWDTDVDIAATQPPPELFPLHGTDIERRLSERERENLQVELTSWILSQFLHGEQGALLAASQLAG
jgi:hypothetical protein